MSDLNKILKIQRDAWNRGHENYGSHIDVLASVKHYLEYFDHLNPAQQKFLDRIKSNPDLKYAKKLCSKANKASRHFVVSLK